MAISSIQRLDFTGFVENKLCMSYKNLFACEAPLLKGKNLCEFLINLDQEEYQFVAQENKNLIEKKMLSKLQSNSFNLLNKKLRLKIRKREKIHNFIGALESIQQLD